MSSIDISCLGDCLVDMTESEEGAFTHVVVSRFPLPEGLSASAADLLVRLPRGFPDATPDMFWLDPAVRRASGEEVPGTSVQQTFDDRNWQRWSRHIGSLWRAGIDSLDTYIAYIRSCLVAAARGEA